MYENATSTIQINGHQSGPIPIRSSVRQGCPMSMLLYALCLNPLLCILENKLTGLRIKQRDPKTAVVAYADDVINICDKTRHSSTTRRTTVLRSGNWGTIQHREIEGHSSRPLGHTGNDYGYPLAHGDKDLRFPHNINGKWFSNKKLVHHDEQDQSTGERRIQQRAQPGHEDPICPRLPNLQKCGT